MWDSAAVEERNVRLAGTEDGSLQLSDNSDPGRSRSSVLTSLASSHGQSTTTSTTWHLVLVIISLSTIRKVSNQNKIFALSVKLML